MAQKCRQMLHTAKLLIFSRKLVADSTREYATLIQIFGEKFSWIIIFARKVVADGTREYATLVQIFA